MTAAYDRPNWCMGLYKKAKQELDVSIESPPHSDVRLTAYILAYETTLGCEDQSTVDSLIRAGLVSDSDEPFIYVEEYAADPNYRLSGGQLMLEFIKKVQNAADSRDSCPRILAEIRTTTALPLLLSHQERLGIEITTLDSYEEGEDRLIPVIIGPKGS